MTETKQDTRPPVTSFTVYRDEWLRGTGNGELLSLEGRRCCLGFYGQSLGVSDEAMRGYADPCDSAGVSEQVRALWPDWSYRRSYLRDGTKEVCVQIVDANDRCVALPWTDAEREEQLTELFAMEGVTVRFEDSRPATPAEGDER